jgi:hypothetical protein
MNFLKTYLSDIIKTTTTNVSRFTRGLVGTKTLSEALETIDTKLVLVDKFSPGLLHNDDYNELIRLSNDNKEPLELHEIYEFTKEISPVLPNNFSSKYKIIVEIQTYDDGVLRPTLANYTISSDNISITFNNYVDGIIILRAFKI